MLEYFKWIINPEYINSNIFTLISVILSGAISWIISAVYFSVGNRNNLKASVLHPIRRLLDSSPSWDKYRSLTECCKDYSMKYLKRKERPIIEELLSSYKDICRYNYESVCAESLFSYFNYKLKKNGVDPSPVPVYIEDELVDVEFPPDMLYFREDVARAVEQYPPEYDTENCTNAVLKLFEVYCKKCYTDKKIDFFDDNSLLEVLKNAKNRSDWNDKFSRFKVAKETFLNMNVLK